MAVLILFGAMIKKKNQTLGLVIIDSQFRGGGGGVVELGGTNGFQGVLRKDQSLLTEH